MQSGMIGKIEKAHRYSEERDRFIVHGLSIAVRGDNAEHEVTLDDGSWRCGCSFFAAHATCAHTMALERVLDGMLPRGSVVAA